MKKSVTSSDHAAQSAENRSTPRRKKKRTPLLFRLVGRLFSVIGATLLTFFLIFVITGSICAIAATAYVVNYMESTTTISIQEMAMSYSTNIYATDADGELVTLYTVQNAIERIPVDLEDVPQHVRDAFVYGEDERFYSHEGVDYKRTLAAFANLILEFWDTFWEFRDTEEGSQVAIFYVLLHILKTGLDVRYSVRYNKSTGYCT